MMRYPRTRTVDVVDDVAGLRLADPYRWLEEDTEEVQMWQQAQARFASSCVRRWPYTGAVGALVRRYSTVRLPAVPRFAGSQWFRAETTTGASPRVVVADEPFGIGRVVVDVSELVDPSVGERSPVLSWLAPSPDGSVLAVGICADGSEQNCIRLIDVPTGVVRVDAPPHMLHDNWMGGVTWLADSSGFFYFALMGSAHEFRQAVFLHRLDSPPPTTPELIPLPAESSDATLIQVSADGYWALATHGLIEPVPVAIRDLTDPDGTWRPFITDVDGTVAGHIIGGRYVAVTDVAAPRGRVVAIPLDQGDPNDISSWAELVPESEAVLRTITPVDDHLYVTELVDTYSNVRIFDRGGRPVGHVPLPGAGVVGEPPFSLMIPQGHPSEFIFSFCTLVTSWAMYRHRPGDVGIELIDEASVALEGAIVEDRWATSRDGTEIPYHTVRLASTDLSHPVPTLIFAYGGFNHPFPPSFPGPMAAFVAAGGQFVHAHLRGGAEFGRTWRAAGRFEHKQNCYDDLYAVAEDLIAHGVTTPDLLGITGRSNGGLMTGVAVTQRPDLWKVAVPIVPMLDLIGGLRSRYTAGSTRADRGDPDNLEDVRRIASYSPYQQIRAGTDYPAVFVSAGATDPRCPPWHARKWGARMQAAQVGNGPILIHIWDGAGHGQATPDHIALADNTEWLSFVMWQLDMHPDGRNVAR